MATRSAPPSNPSDQNPGMCVLVCCDFLASILGIGISKAYSLVSPPLLARGFMPFQIKWGLKQVKQVKVMVPRTLMMSMSRQKSTINLFVPDALNTADSVAKSVEQRRTFKTENKHELLCGKAKKEHEISSKSARFEQVWRKRKGTKEANHDEALKEMCHLYDVVRVDVPEITYEEKGYRNGRGLYDVVLLSAPVKRVHP